MPDSKDWLFENEVIPFHNFDKKSATAKRVKEHLKSLSKLAKTNAWQSYGVTAAELADLYILREEYNEALIIYLKMLYLDLYVTSNLDGSTGISLKQAKEWELIPYGFMNKLTPGIIFQVDCIMKELKLSEEQVKELFHQHCKPIAGKSDLFKLNLEEAWKIIIKDLKSQQS